MLSMAPVSSAGGSANYFAKDNYYSNAESAETSMWYGAGAEMLGLAPDDENALDAAEQGEGAQADAAIDDPVSEETAAGEATLDQAVTDEATGDTPADPDAEQAADSPDDGRSTDAVTPGQGLATDPPLGGDHSEPAEPSGSDVAGGAQPDGGALHDTAQEVHPALAMGIASDIDLEDLPAMGAEPDARDGTATGAEPPAATRAQAMPLRNPSGRVEPGTFENILNGKLPDGTQVGEPGKRALGMDLTFSAPKSVSVLGLIGGDKRLIEANMKAVQTAMRFAEKYFAECRTYENGRDTPVRTGNLVYALFAHDTSRALDPQVHVHAVIANMTRMPNGDWRSLHNGQLWKNNTVLGSVYNAALRENIEKLGYKVGMTGKHGSFEIAGVPGTVREAFSQRREQILAKAAELGIATPQGMDRVTTTTRDAKLNSPDHAVLQDKWEARMTELGYDPSHTIAAAGHNLTGPRNVVEKGAAMIAALKSRFDAAAQVLGNPRDPLLDSRTAVLGGSIDARTQIAVASAIRHLDQREAAIDIHQLTKTALDQGLSGVTPERIATRIGQLIRNEQLVPGVSTRADRQVTMLATSDAIRTEHAILANIMTGKGAVPGVVAPAYATDVLRSIEGAHALNEGQLAAATSIVSSPDRIIAVQGIAGAGKSTMLGTAARVLENNGKNIIGLAFQNKMVGDLAQGAGIEAQTLASFLMPYERMIADNDRAGLAAARKEMRGTVVIVDEASMVSNRQMASLTSLAHTLDLDKLVLVGDRQQLLSIDAGKSFEIVQSRADISRMDENLRQRTDQLRTVAALANRGKAGEALAVLGTSVISTPDRIGAAAALWLGMAPAERERTAILTSGRQTRSNLNLSIQAGLKTDGSLTGAGKTLTVVEQVDRTREDLRLARNYEPGLSLSLWGDEKSLGLKRGEYRIARFIKGGRVQLERDGKKIIIDPKRLSPSRHDDRMTMIATRQLTLHEGDKIRWTANDKARDLHNSAIGRVLAIDAKGVTIETADQTIVRLNTGDPMLRRLDLAYTLNMHMAQGVTTDKAIIVMGSSERMLANQRLFNVGVTRARDAITVVTDDREKLACQLDRTPGDKLSALEVTGQLTPEAANVASPERTPLPKGIFDNLNLGPGPTNIAASASSKPVAQDGLAGKAPAPAPAPDRATPAIPDAVKPAPSQPTLPVPEKYKGLEL